MDNETTSYCIQGSRVYGNGQSYNCTNKVTAEELCNTLNRLIEYRNTSTNIDTKLDTISKQVIQLKLSVNILSEEVEHLKEVMK